MPSQYDEPTIAELLQAFEDGIHARQDRYADIREGAVYQHWGGAAAILWSRLARRDTDLWRAIYFDSAEAVDLTNLLSDRYAFDRVLDGYGTGTALLSRPTTSAGSGTVWKGTRILVYGDGVLPRFFVVAADKPVSASQSDVEVAIRSDRTGKGTAIDLASGAASRARVDDPLWDTTFAVESMTCGEGTEFESAAEARARFRTGRRDARVGFVEAIVAACTDVGASHALLFPSDYAGDAYDYGLNVAYVGDAGFTGTPALVNAVKVKLEAWRVLGDNLQVLPLSRANLAIDADVYLWDSPARVNQTETRALLVGAVLGYFDGKDAGFSYDRDALSGAMMKASPAVQFVTFDSPSSDVAVMQTTGGLPNFPSTLTRYSVRDEDITLRFLPPL